MLPPLELPDRAPRLADGRYVLMSRIGRGGMAGVYAAWDTALEEWRALKVLLPKHARDGGLRARFEREGLTMRSLQHRNLVRVFDVVSAERLPFLVMELIDGGSLYRWTKTYGAMPPRMAVEAMIPLCAGLSAVHGAGVVHRDIKPRNVLTNGDGALKLTDFGIAQLGESQDTHTGLAMGTLGFMSPEQLHDAKSVDLRTDIYAIGATFWSQLTARKARDLFRLEDTPALMDGIPTPLQPLLGRCLAYERGDRYPSAEALSDALSELWADLPPDPPETPPLPLNLSAISFKSTPEHTFSEILTSIEGDLGGEDSDQVSVLRPSPLPARPSPLPAPPAGRVLPIPLPGPVAEDPTAGPPRRSRFAREEPEELPTYLVGIAPPSDIRRPELVTSQGGAAEPVAPARLPLRWVVLTAIGTPALGCGAVLLSFGLALTHGTWRVRAAEEEVAEARLRLSDCVGREAPLAEELLVLDADVRAMREVFERWTNEPLEPGRSEAAVEYVALAEREARTRIGFGRRSHEEEVVRQRLERLKASRDRLMDARTRWAGAARTATGRLSTGLRLASAPVED